MIVLPLIVPLLFLCGHDLTSCQSADQPQSTIPPRNSPPSLPLAAEQPLTAANLNSLAVVYISRGQFEQSRKTFQRVLDLLNRNGEADGTEAARTYHLLGEVAQIQCRFPEAEADFKKSIALLNRSAGPRDLRTANALNSLGWFYNVIGRSQEASVTLGKAWEIAQSVLPEDSPDLIMFLDSQASMSAQSAHFTDAEKNWLRALHIAEKAYGSNPRQYVAILTHLGEMYLSIGDYKSAADFFTRCLTNFRGDGGPISITNAVLMSELGTAYTRLKRYSDAEPLFSRSIELVNTFPNAAPLGDALVLSRAGEFYMARRDWTSAEQQYRRALQLRESALGDHALVADSLRSLSLSLRKLHRNKEATQDEERAKQIMAVQTNPAYLRDTIDVRAFRTK